MVGREGRGVGALVVMTVNYHTLYSVQARIDSARARPGGARQPTAAVASTALTQLTSNKSTTNLQRLGHLQPLTSCLTDLEPAPARLDLITTLVLFIYLTPCLPPHLRWPTRTPVFTRSLSWVSTQTTACADTGTVAYTSTGQQVDSDLFWLSS